MSDMSHTVRITADLAKAKAAASQLKGSVTAADVEKDPKAFLARLGVEVDDQTASMIKKGLSARTKSSATPAMIVHIDG
jgi:hypothetical protein